MSAADLVAGRWRELIELVSRAADDIYSFCKPLVLPAAADPILGRLFPWISVGGLLLSRCTNAPHYVDIGIAARGVNDFVVFITDGHGNWTDEWQIGRGDAETAIRIARAFLPLDYPAAIPGSRNDLRLAEDAATRKVRAARQMIG